MTTREDAAASDVCDTACCIVAPDKTHEARFDRPSTQMASILLIASVIAVFVAGLLMLLRPKTKAD